MERHGGKQANRKTRGEEAIGAASEGQMGMHVSGEGVGVSIIGRLADCRKAVFRAFMPRDIVNVRGDEEEQTLSLQSPTCLLIVRWLSVEAVILFAKADLNANYKKSRNKEKFT